MPSRVSCPFRQLPIEPLSANAFAPFGTVIQNPARGPTAPSALRTTSANQGSAKVHHDVSLLTNFYSLAPSQQPAKAIMNMFVCSPRRLRTSLSKQLFDVSILERHPFTSQTFTPVGLSADDQSNRYIVVVAPTLPESPAISGALPPISNHLQPKGTGLPDLTNARAFLADGSQAVTYAAGTWHSPMVVIGSTPVEFVVVQFSNGVPIEDCQEVILEKLVGQTDGIVVEIEGNINAAKPKL